MKSDSEEGEIARCSGSDAESAGHDDLEDTLEIKPPQRPQRERSDGRSERLSSDWERRDSHKEGGSSRIQDRRHRAEKHHKSRHRERERDSSYRDYDRRRGETHSRESSRHTSRDRRDRRPLERDEAKERDRDRNKDRGMKDAREKLNRNRQQQRQQQQQQPSGNHSSGDEELQRRRERLLAALNERERRTGRKEFAREHRDRERSPQEPLSRSKASHIHPDEDVDDEEDEEVGQQKPAHPTMRGSPDKGDGIGVGALAASSGVVAKLGRKEGGDKASTETEESGSEASEESSTAGESGGAATEDEPDHQTPKKEHSSRHSSARDFTKDGRNDERVDGNGGVQAMEVDAAETDDEAKPPAGAQQRNDPRDIREEDEFLENRTAAAERDNVRDDDSQDGQPDDEDNVMEEIIDYYPAIQGCRRVEEFHCLNRIEEGTYGVVYRAKDKQTNEIVALKRLKMEKEKEGFPITSLREINTLLKAQHPNIVTVREIVVGSNMDKIYIVMDYVEHDLKSLMDTMKAPFFVGEVKTLMLQLLRAVAHMHDNWILHRDLKTSNLLLSHKGILKVGDFGLAREYGSPLKHYTPVVVTLWYRAPELLLGSKEYSCPIDVWSVGCIFGELLTKKPLFPGKSEVDQLNRIFKELGTPSEKIWPGYNDLPMVKRISFDQQPYNVLRKRITESLLSPAGFNLLNALLTYCPGKRVNAEDALRHEWFKEKPDPVEPDMFPTWPAKSEGGSGGRKVQSPKPPSGGQQAKDLLEDDYGFRMASGNKGVAYKGTGFSLKF